MSAQRLPPSPLPVPVVYPDSDGNRMADNTLQYQWIVTIQGELDSAIPDFVAGDLLWYPVKGEPTIRVAPDVMVAPGRPKGHRGSYCQWEEQGVPPKVVWEILSPGNTFGEMQRKLKFYEFYGVDEYYVYDPANQELFGWIRQGDQLVEIPEIEKWTSPFLGIRFELGEELRIYHRDGRRFLSFRENRAEADQERQKAEAERQKAEEERQKAEAERQKAEEERQRADRETARAEALVARLRALGIEP